MSDTAVDGGQIDSNVVTPKNRGLNNKSKNTTSQPRRKSARRTCSESEDSEVQEVSPGSPVRSSVGKRKRYVTGTMPPKAKPGEDEDPTNAQLMKVMNGLTNKFDSLATKADLKRMETEIRQKQAEESKKQAQNTQNNARSIERNARELNKLREDIPAIVQKAIEEQVMDNTKSSTAQAAAFRKEARARRYAIARRSFRIWPVDDDGRGGLEAAIRQFFIRRMGVPEDYANNVVLDTIKPTYPSPKSKIQKEYLVTFAEIESRDAIKGYANGLAESKGQAGLRLDIPEYLKGNFRILEEHANGIRSLYGENVKRNIKFDDINQDLMLDIKLPTSSTWHNITMAVAQEAKAIRDKRDVESLRMAGSTRTNAITNDRAKALMLSLGSPGASNPNFIPIHNMRRPRTAGSGTGPGDDEESNLYQSSGAS